MSLAHPHCTQLTSCATLGLWSRARLVPGMPRPSASVVPLRAVSERTRTRSSVSGSLDAGTKTQQRAQSMSLTGRRGSRPLPAAIAIEGSGVADQALVPQSPARDLDMTAAAILAMPPPPPVQRMSMAPASGQRANGPRASDAAAGKLERKSTDMRNTHNVSRWARRNSGTLFGAGEDSDAPRTLRERLAFWNNCTFRVILTCVNITLLAIVILTLTLYTVLRGEQYVPKPRVPTGPRPRRADRQPPSPPPTRSTPPDPSHATSCTPSQQPHAAHPNGAGKSRTAHPDPGKHSNPSNLILPALLHSRAAKLSTEVLAFEVSYLALQRLSLTMGTVLHAVDSTKAFLLLTTGEVADYNPLAHNLFQALTYLPTTVSMMYAGDPLGDLNAIGRMAADASLETGSPFFWQVVNASTSNTVLYAETDLTCGMLDLTCQLGALTPTSSTLNVTTRPWYLAVRWQRATAAASHAPTPLCSLQCERVTVTNGGGGREWQGINATVATWSPFYLFQYPNSSLTPAGITSVEAIYSTSTPSQLLAVAAAVRAVLGRRTRTLGPASCSSPAAAGSRFNACRPRQDVSLSDLGGYLTSLTDQTLATVKPTLFIVNEYGSLVATSDPSLPVQKTAAEGRRNSTDAERETKGRSARPGELARAATVGGGAGQDARPPVST